MGRDERGTQSSASSKSQKELAIKQFMGLTRAIPTDAARLCKKAGYRVDVAVDMFYADPMAMSNADRAAASAMKNDKTVGKLEVQFNTYRDPDSQTQTDFDGAIRYFSDLSLDPSDPTDPSTLILSHHLSAPRMGIFDKKGWIEGWKPTFSGTKVRCEGGEMVDAQRGKVRELRGKLGRDGEYFEMVYRYTFDFGKDEGQKSFALESAIAFWELLIPLLPPQQGGKKFPDQHLQWWFELLRSKNRAVSRDTWTLFLDFIKSIDPDMSNHDEFAAWPSVIDDYVEFVRKKIQSSGMDTS